MQSAAGGRGGGGGYGGVSEMQQHHQHQQQQQQQQQQFMVDSLFSISTPPPPPPPHHHHHHHPNTSAEIPHILQHQQQMPHPHHLQAVPSPHHFSHFGQQHFPITQQLFHHPHHFQLFHQQQQHHQQLGLDQDSGPENSTSSACRMMGGASGASSFLAAMNFKLSVNGSSGGGGGGSRDDCGGLNDEDDDDDDILQQGHDDDDGSESRLHHHHQHPWHPDDDTTPHSSTPNIKQPFWRPLDIDYINPNNKRPSSKDKQPEEISSNKHFKMTSNDTSINHHQSSNINTPTTNNEAANAPSTTDNNNNNYKLFSELEAIYKPGASPITTLVQPLNNVNNTNNQTGSGSALTGDENPLHLPPASVSPLPADVEPHSDTSNQGGDNAPSTQKKFQKTNRNRSKRRQQKHTQQLTSISAFFESLIQRLIDHQETLHRKFLDLIEKRDQERTVREDAWRAQEAARASREAAARSQERALSAARESAIISFLEKITGEPLNLPPEKEPSFEAHTAIEPYSGGGTGQLSSSRWPKAEVQALIEVRSGLESRFQEPGLKGPLWEEVSAAMGRLGYGRSSKRCKEKWENINKYFRKAKDSGKKRPQHSKTCPYFQMLDQLYSNSKGLRVEDTKKDNSELLDAIIEVAPLRVELMSGEANEEEGQGESQGDAPHEEEQINARSDDSSHLFHRLQS